MKRGAGKFSFEKELLPWGLFEFHLADDVKNIKYPLSFKRKNFTSNTRLKLAKNLAKPKQQPKAELLQFENHSLSSSTLKSKNKRTCSKNVQKHKCVRFNKIT